MPNLLSPENERFLQDLVVQGKFSTQTEALNAAVVLLRKREDYFSQVRAGIGQANSGQLIPANEVFERLQRRAENIDRLADG